MKRAVNIRRHAEAFAKKTWVSLQRDVFHKTNERGFFVPALKVQRLRAICGNKNGLELCAFPARMDRGIHAWRSR